MKKLVIEYLCVAKDKSFRTAGSGDGVAVIAVDDSSPERYAETFAKEKDRLSANVKNAAVAERRKIASRTPLVVQMHYERIQVLKEFEVTNND
jgi:hypothetical protein